MMSLLTIVTWRKTMASSAYNSKDIESKVKARLDELNDLETKGIRIQLNQASSNIRKVEVKKGFYTFNGTFENANKL